MLPAIMAIIASLGLPSLRTKPRITLLTMNAKEKHIIVFKYVPARGKILLSAPNSLAISSEKNIPMKVRTKLVHTAIYNACVKTLLPCSFRPFPIKIENRVAAPMPSIKPTPFTRLYIGKTKFSAVSPMLPTPFAMKRVSTNT